VSSAMTGSERKTILDSIGRLLASQRVGVLGTHYHDEPHQSLIAYITSEDHLSIYFTTPPDTRKVAAMEKDPRVAFLVDDRQNVESAFDGCTAVTAYGIAEPMPEPHRHSIVLRYRERHPYLEEFVGSPSCRWYRIRVQRYSLVSRFQSVEELSLQA
jgi:heme iron utilization protein